MMTKFASFGCLAATAAALLMTSSVMAEQGEVDPGQVSEGLKAIFSYGRGNHTTQDHLNANTTTVITGTIGGTYVQIGADLASMLDDGEKLRILPIVGRGSVQSLADILYLKGVDLGIVRSDTLDYLEKKGFATNIKGQLSYITKLYNEEMHVVAAKTIQKMSDLEGKTVSVDLPNGGTFITAITVFDRLGIKPKFVYTEQRVAYEKLRKGEIDAMVAVQGVPSKFTTTIKDERFPPRPDRIRACPAGGLPAVATQGGGLSLIGPRRAARRYDRGAGDPRCLQLAPGKRAIQESRAFCAGLLRQV